jgi:hypothetical protein
MFFRKKIYQTSNFAIDINFMCNGYSLLPKLKKVEAWFASSRKALLAMTATEYFLYFYQQFDFFTRSQAGTYL